MRDAATLISSLASLLWPIVVAVFVIFLLPTLRKFLRGSDSLTVEVAGTKISMQLASEELRNLVSDLQDRVNILETDRRGEEPAAPDEQVATSSYWRVLWVDDREEANVYERARLQDAEYQVVQAESTTSALNRLRSRGPFHLIISDMARVEAGGNLNTRAGLELLRELRQLGDMTHVIFYSSARSLAAVRAELDTEEHVSYTTSPSELMRLARLYPYS